MSRATSARERAELRFRAGNTHLARSAFEEAQRDFEETVALNPRHAEAHLGLATALRRQGRTPAAESSGRTALAEKPRYAEAAHFLGTLLVEQDRLAEALPFLQSAVDWAPDVVQHHRDLGITQLFLGDLDGARERLLKTIDLDVHSHEALYTLVRMWRMDDGSEAAARLLDLVTELEARASELPDAERAQVLFALGKAREDRGEYAEAAKTFARANAVRRSAIEFDLERVEARFRRTAKAFSARLLGKLAGAGDPSTRPIFVVGMPRSGSTLVEQILASHPDVHGGGELNLLSPLLANSTGLGGAPYPDWGAAMTPSDCAAVGKAYLEGLPEGAPPRSHTTDKWLANFEHLGLISVCLPRAKVIHCVRDPRDQLLSCWSLLFSQHQEYAYDPQELVGYHRAYQRLMAHWRDVLPPGLMLDVQYESLVGEPRAQAERILRHCGLEWDEQVLRFWEARRPVRTASLVQVREPIYDRSIGRWRQFAGHIPELFAGYNDP